ncbi:hypothetical protein BJV77DRAFT_193368 [Russula vinacea]|nr:hypothetical protein BJV77DRAFT_193368 [Russula vinacea]
MSSYVLRCYIKGDNKPFPVVVPPTLPIGLLKEMINDRHSNLLREVDASSLILSKVNVVYDTVIDEVLNGKYQPDEQQLLANAMSPISELWPEPPLNGYLHIYVSLPVVGSPIVNVGDDKPVDLNFVKEYEKIFIKVKEWGAFDDSDIQRNGLCSHRRGTQTPEFVAEFERKLVSKPCPAPDCRLITFTTVSQTVKFWRNILSLL